MQQWRFVLERKWLQFGAGALVFTIICVIGSAWQWHTFGQVVSALHLQNQNYDQRPVAIGALLPDREAYSADDQFRKVSVSGHYLSSKTFLARDRSYNDNPGFEVLVPLQTASGSVFIVDRGWLATGTTHDYPDSIPAPPSGRVTVTARLAASEPQISGRTDIPGSDEVAVIGLPDLQSKLHLPTYTGAYGQMVSESPAVATRPAAILKPVIDYGPTLFTAIAIALAGLVAVVLYFTLINREFDNRYSDEEDRRWLDERREYRRARRGPADDELEDEILDEADYTSSKPGTRISRGI
ncbi:hypothetical protein AX769_13045 [Frondihabitans sp. PAMC 28766]|uniref:SURF1 family protein n=1 Tax=Frondihabitans sp. PAMC 28766 TaxID=1795630 RepID=UPI00078BD5E2|nr:SURF1 family protein [Frondihabitans sp. PAMC 28766]AMM20897.1 hypothetical protein AX769_13045 [Frondihabitans sp. PAMC 28766]